MPQPMIPLADAIRVVRRKMREAEENIVGALALLGAGGGGGGAFHPLDLSPVVFLWPTNDMYQDAGSTLATDADHPVKQWNNLGSGGHAIAPTDAKRPLLKLNLVDAWVAEQTAIS